MTIRDLLRSANIEPLDAALLLGSVLGRDRSWLLAHETESVAEMDEKKCQDLFKRARKSEPIAYILGKKEFFGRDFLVDGRVLIPRPATERLVEIALDVLKNPRDVTEEIDSEIVAFVRFFKRGEWEMLVDIGSGSGCVSITLALEGRNEKIIGVDSSGDAITLAKENQKKLGAKNIEWVHRDGIEFVESMNQPFVLISNPPYIPEGTKLESTVSEYEPHGALFAGKDGMDVIRPLFEAAKNNQNCRGVIMEMRADQASFLNPTRG